MSLAHALLTALAECPSTGAELVRRFDRSIGYFWPATHQQIYRELGTLEASGWVEASDPGPGQGRTRFYRLLPAGREELHRWIGQIGDPRPIREEMMVALRAAAAVGPGDLAVALSHHLERHREKCDHYRAIEARDFADPDMPRERRLQYLVLKAGIAYETQWVAICEEALGILES